MAALYLLCFDVMLCGVGGKNGEWERNGTGSNMKSTDLSHITPGVPNPGPQTGSSL